ncbi:GTPase IMAP family member 8-like [Menidia menidia]
MILYLRGMESAESKMDTDEVFSQPINDDFPRRIVILGKTGAGKSSLANTLFGKTVCTTNHTPESGTSVCQKVVGRVNGKQIVFVDTPGFFDTRRPEEEMKAEVVRCITECAPGPHVFLIVLRVDKFTEQEKAIVRTLNDHFSEEVLKYGTVVFTHGDQLDERIKIEEFVDQSAELRALIGRCGGRCNVFDNKYWQNNQGDEYRSNKFQIQKLLDTIDKIIEENKGKSYTNELLQTVEQKIQEAECIQESTANLSPEEREELAKAKVRDTLSHLAVRVTTRDLLKVFLSGAMKSLSKEDPILGFGLEITAALAGTAMKPSSRTTSTTSDGNDKWFKAVVPSVPIILSALQKTSQTGRGTTKLGASPSQSMREGLTVENSCFSGSMDEPDTLRVVLLGGSGNGKSSLANVIFGETTFKVKRFNDADRCVTHAESRRVNGRNLTLIDTPGVFGPGSSEKDVKLEILRCIIECAPGPHAFLIVLKMEKFTEQEQSVISEMCQCFSEDFLKHAVVVFTHGDQLPEEMKIQEYVVQSASLNDLVEKCGGRCHVFDSKYWKDNQEDDYRSNQFQGTELLRTIHRLVEENSGGYFTNPMILDVEKKIQKEEELIKKLSKDKSPEEIRKQAKSNIMRREVEGEAGSWKTGFVVLVVTGLFVTVSAILLKRRFEEPAEVLLTELAETGPELVKEMVETAVTIEEVQTPEVASQTQENVTRWVLSLFKKMYNPFNPFE